MFTCCVHCFSLFFKGWQWTKQRATLLHRALLAQDAWPSDSRPHQWGSDPWTEVRSRDNAISLPCGAGHRPGSGSHSEALGFGHGPSVCDGRKRQRSGLQLAVCSQCHGGSACRVSRMSYCNLFLAVLMYSSVVSLISSHNRGACNEVWLKFIGFNMTFRPCVYRQLCDFVRDGSRWRWRRKWQSVIQNPDRQQRWSFHSQPQHWWANF